MANQRKNALKQTPKDEVESLKRQVASLRQQLFAMKSLDKVNQSIIANLRTFHR